MKPRILKLQAFGPYARQATIDFSSLQNGGLFLIHGQTGAGKTSLLDGLSFALFGTASGTDRTSDGLRSDLAPSDLPTEAVLEFSLGSDLYRVSREPNQTLKKKRGDGTTTSKSNGKLEKWIDGQWTLVAAGAKKTDEAVVSLLGMTEDQFRQVVVLPQGQFRKFLAAGSDDREDLLERLFRTERYRFISEALEKKARAASQEFSQTRVERDALLSTLEVRDAAELKERVNTLQSELASLSGQSDATEKAYAELATQVQVAREQLKLREEFAVINERKQSLETQTPAQQLRVKKLGAHAEAQPLLALDVRTAALSRDLERLTKARTDAQSALPAASEALERALGTRTQLESRRPEIEAAGLRREALRAAYGAHEKLTSERSQLAKQEASIASAEAGLKAHESKLDKFKTSRPALDAEIAHLMEQASSEGKRAAEIQLVDKKMTDAALVVKQVEQRSKLEADLARGATALSELDRKISATEIDVKKLKLDFHRSEAARLALELKEGEPCPVCGSLEHPSPAKNTHAVTPDAIETREADLETLKSQRSKADSAMTRLQAEHATLPHVTFEEANAVVLDLNTQRLDLEKQLQAAKLAGQTLATARARLNTQVREIEQLERERQTHQDHLADLRSFRASSLAKISELESQIPSDMQSFERLKSEGLELKTKIETFNAAVETSQRDFEAASAQVTRLKSSLETLEGEITSKTGDLRDLERELASAVSLSSFADLESARAASLTPADLTDLERARREFETEWAKVSARRGEIESLLRDPVDGADLARLETSFNEADQRRTESRALALSKKERLNSLTAASLKIDELDARAQSLEKRYSVVGRLSDAAAGRAPNLSRVGFQRYVLGSRLDEVLDQASRRLYLMSRGQFALRRSRTLDDKRKNAGLDLEVEDALSGTTRPTASLSGGEGFLASLALALGLADVVQNHLGGVRLDAVFVDEGFGTLDPEALEQAMRTLTDLQAGGRMVGIISHVPELRDQISKRLVIKKGIEGSTVTWENG